MTCFTFCVGIIKGQPKRFYYNGGQEISNFFVLVRRDSKEEKYDMFYFEAWNEMANKINTKFNNGDVVSILARPFQNVFTKKNGTKVQSCKFRVIEIKRISSKSRVLSEEVGNIELFRMGDINYDDTF